VTRRRKVKERGAENVRRKGHMKYQFCPCLFNKIKKLTFTWACVQERYKEKGVKETLFSF